MKRLLMCFAGLLFLLPGAHAQQYGQNLTGNLTAASATCNDVANGCVWMKIPAYNPQLQFTATVTVAGTWSGTIVIERGSAGAWTTIQSTTSNLSATAFTVTGYTDFRVRISAFTSGTANVTIALAETISANANATSVNGATVPASNGALGSNSSGQLIDESQTIGPNQNASYVSTKCGTQTNCTTVHADAQYVTDATSNSTTTVTCPNSDCNFTSADVGKTVWATTQGTGAGVGYLLYTTYVCPVTTIATVNSAQSITLNLACTASGTGNVVLIWGTKDGAALQTAAGNGCNTLYLPQGMILDDQPFMNHSSHTTCSRGLGGPSGAIIGPGGSEQGATLIITPDFNYAGCTGIGGTHGVCIGSDAQFIGYVNIWGTGLTSASNTNCPTTGITFIAPDSRSGWMDAVDLAGICPGAATFDGIVMNNPDAFLDEGGAQEVGTSACVAFANGVQSRGNDCHNLDVSGGIGMAVYGKLVDFGSFELAGVVIEGAGYNMQSFGTTIVNSGSVPAIEVKSGGTWSSLGDFVSSTTSNVNALLLDSGGTAQSCGTRFSAPSSAGYAINVSGSWLSDGDYVGLDGTASAGGMVVNSGGSVATRNTQFKGSTTAISQGGTVLDQGGNTVAGGAVQSNSSTVWTGPQILNGACSGTATSSATLGLYGLGEAAATTCTSTTVNLGVPLSRSGTLYDLNITATHAGVNASSGVVTVLKNGSATTLTCTVGTGTACADTTHSVAYAVGDIISVQFTTQTSEVLAGVKATVVAW